MGKYSKKKIVKKSAIPAKSTIQKDSSSSSFKFIYLFLFLFAFLLYANTLKHEYAFDDSAAIVENGYTKAGIKGIPDLLTKDFFQAFSGKESDLGGRWRPLSLIMFAIEYQFFGANPHVNHWVNVFLYAMTAIVLFMLMQKILPRQPTIALLTTLFFIAHPVHTEVVANIKSRDEILSLLGLSFTILFLFRYIESGKMKFMIFSSIAYFLSLASKENGITFLAIIPLILVCFAGKTWKESILKILPLFAVAIVYIIIRWKMVGMIGDTENNQIMSNPFEGATGGEKYATITKILGKYLMLVIFPVKLAYDYSYNEIPRVNWSDTSALLSLVSTIGLILYAAITVFKPRSSNSKVSTGRIIAFGILFYYLTISIVSNAVFNVGAPMADRFLYLPSLGFCLILAIALIKLFRIEEAPLSELKFSDFMKLNSKPFAIAFIILAFYSFKTVARNPVWKNNRTLYESGIYDAPGDALNHHRFANQLLSVDAEKETDSLKRDAIYNRCIEELNKTIDIVPENFNAFTDLGALYERKNDNVNAIRCYDMALKYNPNSIRTLSNKGVILAKEGRYEEAKVIFKQAVAIDTTYSDALSNLGLCYYLLKEFDNALFYFNRTVVYEKQLPKKAYVYERIADIYTATGNKAKADSSLAIAKELRSENK